MGTTLRYAVALFHWNKISEPQFYLSSRKMRTLRPNDNVDGRCAIAKHSLINKVCKQQFQHYELLLKTSKVASDIPANLAVVECC